jgi:hypothetical protein
MLKLKEGVSLTTQEDLMRKHLLTVAMLTVGLGLQAPAVAAQTNGYAASKKARATALTDCERQARAMRFGKQTIQRRNFLKDCMIDRGFYGDVN